MSPAFRVYYRYDRSTFGRVVSFVKNFNLPMWTDSLAIRGVLLGLIVLVAVGYVFKTNSLSTSGYKTYDLDKQISVLQQDVDQLQTQVAEAQSLTTINKRLGEIKMVQATDIKYLSAEVGQAVAKK